MIGQSVTKAECKRLGLAGNGQRRPRLLHFFLDRGARGWGITSGKGGKPRHLGPLALKATRTKGPLALKPTRPRENTSDRIVFIKTVQMLNPDIDYQDAATAYDDYFAPLKERARFERQKSGHRPPGHRPGPTVQLAGPRSPYRRPAMRSREPRPSSSYRGARRNRILREEKGVWSHKCATCPVCHAGLFLLCDPIAYGAARVSRLNGPAALRLPAAPPFPPRNLRESPTNQNECFVMSNPASPPARRGVEQILATCDNTTLVVKASRDGKLEVMINAFKNDDTRVTILDDERLGRFVPGAICRRSTGNPLGQADVFGQ
jgi:hypothetical protein